MPPAGSRGEGGFMKVGLVGAGKVGSASLQSSRAHGEVHCVTGGPSTASIERSSMLVRQAEGADSVP